MAEVTYVDEVPALADVLPLYAAVGWKYGDAPLRLERALSGSDYVTAARRGGLLVGLARTVSDDASVWFLQDLLVHPDLQRQGVGSALLRRCAARYAHVPRGVLLTDADGTAAFYERLGWTDEPRVQMLLHSTPAGPDA